MRHLFHVSAALCAAFVVSASLAGAAPMLQLSVTNYNFGNRSVNDGPTSVAITFSSVGSDPLEFQNAGIQVIGNSAFSITDMPSTSTMAPGTTRTLVAAFDPSQKGLADGIISFTTNDSFSQTKDIALQGYGTWADVALEAGSLNFGNKVITDPDYHSLYLDIKNQGTEPLQFLGNAFSISTGPSPTSFKVLDNPSTAPIAPYSETRRIRIGFKTATLGSKSAFLQIRTNDFESPTIMVPLSGTGIAPRTTPFTGLYNGYGPGTSTIGTGGHYASLNDACDATSAAQLTGGNWNFLILNDLNETQNSDLTLLNTGGYDVVFRPAAGTSVTVNFTNTSVNPREFPGHLVIGARYIPASPIGDWVYTPTQHVIIDGSNDPTTNTRNLTFRSIERVNGTTSLIHVAGDSDFIKIRNCHFYHTNGFYTSVYGAMGAVEFFGERTPFNANPLYIFSTADYGTVENCNFLIKGNSDAPAITSNHRGSTVGSFPVQVSSKGMVFTGNTIWTPFSGIYVKGSQDAVISNNRILSYAGTFSLNAGIAFNRFNEVSTSAACTIDSNLIQFTGSPGTINQQVGIYTAAKDTPTTIVITNNMISGLSAPPPAQQPASRAGITYPADINTTSLIAHNSINFYQADGTTTTRGRVMAFDHVPANQPFNGYCSIQSNIIRMETDEGAIFRRINGTGTVESNNNVLAPWPSSYVGVAGLPGVGYRNLLEWQQATGTDLNSFVRDPMLSAGSGESSYTWHGSPGMPNPDMHWTGFPGPGFCRPPVAGVTHDFDGELRHPAETMIGADEVEKTSSVDGWRIY